MSLFSPLPRAKRLWPGLSCKSPRLRAWLLTAGSPVSPPLPQEPQQMVSCSLHIDPDLVSPLPLPAIARLHLSCSSGPGALSPAIPKPSPTLFSTHLIKCLFSARNLVSLSFLPIFRALCFISQSQVSWALPPLNQKLHSNPVFPISPVVIVFPAASGPLSTLWRTPSLPLCL